jgi:hypothetical protein
MSRPLHGSYVTEVWTSHDSLHRRRRGQPAWFAILRSSGSAWQLVFCVWLGGSLLAEQIAHPSDTRQMLSDRVDLVAPSQTTGPDAPDAWVDEQDLEASHVGY